MSHCAFGYEPFLGEQMTKAGSSALGKNLFFFTNM